jgi:asparagine synthase (glutamine-hydrolysing)
MCGICGAVDLRVPGAALAPRIETMKERLAHRGPDGEGTWSGDGVCLGHRRLAIIDLSANGAQPISNAEESLVLVCNGEIYNHNELRADLRSRGHVFRGRSDNEVILHLYAEYGAACVDHLVGMFAFAIWDVHERTLFLARDRIGEKPLYYAEAGGVLYFASEIKALLATGVVSNELHPKAIANLMMFAAAPAPDTPFAAIAALPPASRATVKDGRVSTERYWQVHFDRNGAAGAEAIDAYQARFDAAVAGCCESDVPIAITLSGGVDSSSVALEAAAARDGIASFCVGDGSSDDPEFERAAQVAAHAGLDHHNVAFEALDVVALPHVLAAYDQPINSFPAIYAAQLAGAVADHCKVAIGGGGADEVFGGYDGYHRQRALGLMWAVPGGALVAGFAGRDDLRGAARQPMTKRRGYLMQRAAERAGTALLSGEALTALRETRPAGTLDAYAAECDARDYLDTVTYTDLMVTHQHGTTAIPDASGMAHGLEIRSPFLNHRLIEFAASLPRRWTVPSLFDPSRNKAIVKAALARRLPPAIAYARKMGFGYAISLPDLLCGPWRPLVERFVGQGRYRELGHFRPDAVATAAANPGPHTWMLLVFSLWAEMYLFGETPESLGETLRGCVGATGGMAAAC